MEEINEVKKLKDARKIKQILPAEHWYMETETGSSKSALSKLIFWAVCEGDDGNDFVTGLYASQLSDSATLLKCSESPFFKSYVCKDPAKK